MFDFALANRKTAHQIHVNAADYKFKEIFRSILCRRIRCLHRTHRFKNILRPQRLIGLHHNIQIVEPVGDAVQIQHRRRAERPLNFRCIQPIRDLREHAQLSLRAHS